MIPIVVEYVLPFMPHSKGILAPVIATCVCAAILYPISSLSYHFLEKPFLSFGNLTTK